MFWNLKDTWLVTYYSVSEPVYCSVFLPYAHPKAVEVLGIRFSIFPLNLHGLIYTASPLLCTRSFKISFRNCIFHNVFMTAYFPKEKWPGSFPQLSAEYGVSKGICLQYCMKMFLVSLQYQPKPRIPSEAWSRPICLCKTIATNNVWCILDCVMKDS